MKCSYCRKEIEFDYFLCESSNEVWCNDTCLYEDNHKQGYTDKEIDKMLEDDVVFWTTL